MSYCAKNIAIYLPNNVIGLSATLIKDLCWVATANAAELANTHISPEHYVQFVSHDGKAVTCFSGNSISVDLALSELEEPDVIFLAAFWGTAHDAIDQNQALIEHIKNAHHRGTSIVATSNATFFIAEAGLLDNKIATVYPPLVDSFAQRYPLVDLQASRAITHADNLYCANGIASGCDLIVSIIEMLYGPEIARQISHDFLIGFNRSYSIANVSFDGQKYHRDEQILTAQQELEQHYAEEITLESIARKLGMSPRNFSRRFKRATGDSPSHYLLRLRMEAAKELLRNSSLSVAEIAYKVGYSDLSYFTRTFKRHENCLPHTFREEVE